MPILKPEVTFKILKYKIHQLTYTPCRSKPIKKSLIIPTILTLLEDLEKWKCNHKNIFHKVIILTHSLILKQVNRNGSNFIDVLTDSLLQGKILYSQQSSSFCNNAIFNQCLKYMLTSCRKKCKSSQLEIYQ